eukprot:1154540-Pelagomonas_calceolata.AAC.4
MHMPFAHTALVCFRNGAVVGRTGLLTFGPPDEVLEELVLLPVTLTQCSKHTLETLVEYQLQVVPAERLPVTSALDPGMPLGAGSSQEHLNAT